MRAPTYPPPPPTLPRLPPPPAAHILTHRVVTPGGTANAASPTDANNALPFVGAGPSTVPASAPASASPASEGALSALASSGPRLASSNGAPVSIPASRGGTPASSPWGVTYSPQAPTRDSHVTNDTRDQSAISRCYHGETRRCLAVRNAHEGAQCGRQRRSAVDETYTAYITQAKASVSVGLGPSSLIQES